MRSDLKRLQRRLGITTVFVTHDQSEALMMSDRIGLMRDGKLEQHGSPRELYERPANQFVGDFLGKTVPLRATRNRPAVNGSNVVKLDGAEESNGEGRGMWASESQ
jgi:iron(III) transport system ATP-binding protein